MFEIRTNDEVGAVLAVTDTISEAFGAIEAIEYLTAAQLAANSEGAAGFILKLVIHHDGHPYVWHASSVVPTSGQ
jgi:hypothetical protein